MNSLIKALNDRTKLPKLVIIIPDWDLLKYFGDDSCSFDVSTISKRVLLWMVTNINRALATSKEDLRKTKTGVVGPGEPRIIWMKMINRKNVSDRVLTVRNRFNNALENVLMEKTDHFILNINQAMDDQQFFSQSQKKLTDQGKKRFRVQIDLQIKNFD